MEEEAEVVIKVLIKVWLKVLISLIYTYFIVSKIPKGKLRFLSLLPIFTLFTLLPLSLSTTNIVGLLGFFYTWLANFKLVLFAFNLGPLSHDLSKSSFLIFLLVAAFPIKIKKDENYQYVQTKNVDPNVPLNLWSKFLTSSLIALLLSFFSNYNKHVHPYVLVGLYCCIIYLSLEMIMGICTKLVGSILGMELCEPFDKPYLSTSLQNFWGRRWNIIVSDVLRYTIYFPVRSFLEIRIGKDWAQILARMAAFAVSGLMHELIFFYITRASPTWEVTCFFLLHGVSMVFEIELKRALGLRDLHWALVSPLVLGYVMITGCWLFFPQLMRNQYDVKLLEKLKVIISFLKERLALA